MKLVIDIPKRVYDYILKKGAIANSDRLEVAEFIINGTKPKTGHWIYKNYNWHCSECDETPKTMGYVGDADFMREHFKYCNHCGAKMEWGGAMSIGTTIELLIDFWHRAMHDETINKPIAWSLYQVWKVADKMEKPRKAKEQNE